jgi:hypothetical protein
MGASSEERIRQLERLLGRNPLEVEILKEAVAAARAITAVALAVVRSGRFPAKAVADTLGMARSNLVEQAKRGGSGPRPQDRKAGDAELLARIRSLVDARRATATRNRALLESTCLGIVRRPTLEALQSGR